MEGVSFMVRVRDEEQTLEACIRSVLPLRIPMEIVVVLHRCTDGSAGIVEGLAREDERIRVYEYHEELSRAGYETLATSAASRHSIVAYDSWCFAKTRLPWVFKWDADFVCTDELRAFLESRKWPRELGKFRLTAANSTSRNREWYLACGQVGYAKHVFWEYPCYEPGEYADVELDVAFEHRSELAQVKSYWTEAPWFETQETEEAREVRARVAKLVETFGPEPRGAARASNPECDPLFWSVVNANPTFVDLYA
jgi:hypothetical protein